VKKESKMNENNEKPMIKSPTLFVATPMYGGMCIGNYASALMQMPMVISKAGIKMYYTYMMNESLITRARNSLAYDFLASEATHLMFIDADIGFNPSDIVEMVKRDVDICCGLYPKKEIHWQRVADAVNRGVPADQLKDHTGTFVVNLVKEEVQEVKMSELLEIQNGGTGFMLIKREVFEALADKVPEYNSDMFLAVDTVRTPKIIKEFFATSIDPESNNRLLSEDYHFCKLARQHGFKVHAAPWVQLSHTGTYVFSGALQRVS
jgi:hypothetical protein